MTNYKEIITKAIIGKAKKSSSEKHAIECDEKPDTVLGCWVINHKFHGLNTAGVVTINGSYDVNVWYSFNNDTKTTVCSKTLNYQSSMNIPLKDNTLLDNRSEIIVECLKQPTVSDVSVSGGVVNLKIDKLMGVEVIGNTTVKIAVEDDFDDYEEIFDSEDESELDINVDELSDNYLEENSTN